MTNATNKTTSGGTNGNLGGKGKTMKATKGTLGVAAWVLAALAILPAGRAAALTYVNLLEEPMPSAEQQEYVALQRQAQAIDQEIQQLQSILADNTAVFYYNQATGQFVRTPPAEVVAWVNARSRNQQEAQNWWMWFRQSHAQQAPAVQNRMNYLVGLRQRVLTRMQEVYRLMNSSVTVRNVTSLHWSDAQRAMGEAGLRIAWAYTPTTIESWNGYVAGQSIAAGAQVRPGTTVTVTLYKFDATATTDTSGGPTSISTGPTGL